MRPLSLCLALAFLGAGTAARAQESLLVQPALPDDFDRGRNTSVLQRERPGFDPLGIRLGSFVALPQLALSGGYSDNLYYSRTNRVGDGYVDIAPSVELKSDWSRHSLSIRSGATFERYLSETARNQTPWNLDALGEVEIGTSFKIIPEAQIERRFESPFSGETAATTAVLSSYLRKYASLRGEYEAGQTKFTLSVDDTNFAFANVEFASGSVVDQSTRDRNMFRTTGQAQYAFTPSVAAYLQLNYSHIAYDRELLATNLPNRDSNGYRLIGGFNFDLSGLLRGSFGVGYAQRDFRTFYPKISGFSAEAKIEYFPSELTTFTLTAHRVIEDSSISVNSGYFDTRAGLSVDHELLRNLLLHLSGEYAQLDYINLDAKTDIYRVTGGAQYLSSDKLSFSFNLAYTGRTVGGNTLVGEDMHEFRGQLGVTFKR